MRGDERKFRAETIDRSEASPIEPLALGAHQQVPIADGVRITVDTAPAAR